MYPCIRSVHVVHAEPYSARVRVCAPEHELGCGQWTEDGGTDSRSSVATLATDHPPSPDTDGAKRCARYLHITKKVERG